MHAVPFFLKVPGTDSSSGATIAWTTYTITGMLHFDGTCLSLQWSGVGSLDAVTGLDVESTTVALPPEHLIVPLLDIHSLRTVGGWWRRA